MEAIVIGLAIPVAITIEHVHTSLAGMVGGVAAVAAVILAAAAARGSRAALIGGTVLQALLIVAGVEVPAMFVLGVIFAALWATSIWLGRRIGRLEDRIRADADRGPRFHDHESRPSP